MREISNIESVLSSVASDADTGWVSKTRYVDWIGNIWNKSDFPLIPEDSPSLKTPVNGDGFRAGRLEWLGFGIALSKLNDSDRRKSVVVELGSSQAPWCLSWIRAVQKMQLSIETLAIGVEAGLKPGQLKQFWNSQKLPGHVVEQPVSIRGVEMNLMYESNTGKEKFFMLNGAVTHNKREVYFPEVDVTKDNGAKAASRSQEKDYRGYSLQHKLVRSIPFWEIISLVEKIDFLHLDLQGEELKIVRSLIMNKLDSKCSVLLVGTHSLRAHLYWKILLKTRGFIVYESNAPIFSNGILREDGEILALSRVHHT
jgi:hypothetical protein